MSNTLEYNILKKLECNILEKEFKKDIALKAMIDGYIIVHNQLKDNDTFIIWHNYVFLEVHLKVNNKVNKRTINEIDVNALPKEYYSLAEIHENSIPQTLWKSHVDDAYVKKLKFHSFYRQDQDTQKKTLNAICVYTDCNDKQYGVKLSINFLKPFHLNIYSATTIATEGIHHTQKEAENRLKYWTEYQIRNQKKAKNKILKTTEKANKILENKPEIFI